MKKITYFTQCLIVVTFILTTVQYSVSQDFSGRAEIRKILTSSDKKKLDKADKILKEANALMMQTTKLDKEGEQLRAMADASGNEKSKKDNEKKAEKIEIKSAKSKIDASKDFSKANTTYFSVYKDNFKLVRDKVGNDETKLNKGKELESEANTLFKKADTKRDQSLKISDPIKAALILGEADELESLAIEKQINAYGVYLGWYTEKEDTTSQESITTVDAKDVKLEDNTLPDYTTTSDNTTTENKQTGNNTNQNNTENKTENKTVNNNTQVSVIYKIQIAASRTSLSLTRLREIYPSNEMINNELEGGWYKYSVGKFSTYEEASKFKARMGVKDAFIIAYKNGVKVDIGTVNPELKNSNVTNGSNNTNTFKSISNTTGNALVYRIQLAATRIPATQAQMNAMNPTDKKLYTVKVNGWHKYTIGDFNTEYEAEQYKTSKKLKGVVVPYKNGEEQK